MEQVYSLATTRSVHTDTVVASYLKTGRSRHKGARRRAPSPRHTRTGNIDLALLGATPYANDWLF